MKKQSAIFSILQSIGRSFMLPIALLPIAGLLLGIGASFTNQTTVASYNLGWLLGTGTFLNYILEVMSSVGNVIFGNLPIIFAVGVALGMAKSEKAAAALSGLIAFLSMHTVISSMLKLSGQLNAEIIGTNITNTCGIVTLNMGVFGGILVGLLVGWLHNKFYKIKFPDYLSFFSGIRFVPIISAIFHIFIGFIMFYLWPIIQNLMFSSSGIVGKSGPIGILVYGIIKRSLIPFGLHHVFYMPFWQTALGGTEIIDGVSISGAQNIFFAQLASGNTKFFSIEATKFFSGEFLFMIFGLPGAALAMYTTSKPHKKPIIGGLLFSAALTSILTGITEPIEFTFLFVAPLLYGAHCVLAGISHMATYMCKISVGLTFSGGLIDYLLFGIFQGNTKTNWIYIFPLGICCFGIYYFLFKFLIIKFNFLTPGREADDLKSKLFTKEDYKNVNWDQNIAAIIVNCLGGAGNIETIDSCATRLRVEVKDTTKVSESELRKNGAAGIITKGKGIQVIFGPKVTTIKSEIDEYLEKNEGG
ncbi:MAG: PTS transporter subunit IIABC [Candidatus Improbicoccus devescovinae]|nr:MAG: PTS transporter subunit IIABC [Candidatus Improbicoccus devescovinae]